MALEEGFRRMKKIIRGIIVIGLVLDIVGFIGVFLGTYVYRSPWPLVSLYAALGLCLSFLGAILWLGVWVAEGFLLGPKAPPQ